MMGSTFFAMIGFIRYGREVTGAPSGDMVILNRIREHEPKSVLDPGFRAERRLNRRWPMVSSRGRGCRMR